LTASAGDLVAIGATLIEVSAAPAVCCAKRASWCGRRPYDDGAALIEASPPPAV